MEKKNQTQQTAITHNQSSTSLIHKVEQLFPLAYYMPDPLSKALRKIHTIDDALEAETDSIATLCRNRGEEKIEALIALHLARLNKFLDLKNPLTGPQCDEIAAEVVSEYKWLKMADIHVILRRVKTGENGELYERLSMPKVLSWFRDYAEERIKAAVRKNEDEKSKLKMGNGNDERIGRPILLKDKLVNVKL